MNKKPFGKKAEPTGEELEFIYSRLEKLSDKEVLEEMKDTEFPVRSLGFMIRRRREFNAAKRVLEAEVKKEFNPIIIKQKEQHFTRLASIASAIISHGLDKITRIRKQEGQFEIFEYATTPGLAITRKQLSKTLADNISETADLYGDFEFGNLYQHLKAEYQDINSKGLNYVIENNPYELVQLLRILAQRKTFKGSCPVCKDW